ncbi:MAG: radical SAM protein, partial [Candidatus Muiribacteriota bacterium]
MNLKKLKSLTRLAISNVTGKTFIYGISVKLTEKCPMNCVYCYEKKQFEEVEYKKLILFLKKYIKKGLYTVILSGGDPYDYSKIESLINFLKKHGLHIIFNTSGYYI